MPTYEYRCPEGHEFELMQRMSDRPRAKCPVCGRSAIRQISGGAGLIFKGSGFYITDYGKDGKGPRQEQETEAKAPATPAATDESTASTDKADKAADKADKTEKTDKTDRADKTNKADRAEKADRTDKGAKPPTASKSARKKPRP